MPYANDAANHCHNKVLSIGRRTKMSHIHICRRRRHCLNVFLFFFTAWASSHLQRKLLSITNGYCVTIMETQYFHSPSPSLSLCASVRFFGTPCSLGGRHLYTFSPAKYPWAKCNINFLREVIFRSSFSLQCGDKRISTQNLQSCCSCWEKLPENRSLKLFT